MSMVVASSVAPPAAAGTGGRTVIRPYVASPLPVGIAACGRVDLPGLGTVCMRTEAEDTRVEVTLTDVYYGSPGPGAILTAADDALDPIETQWFCRSTSMTLPAGTAFVTILLSSPVPPNPPSLPVGIGICVAGFGAMAGIAETRFS